MTLSPGARVSLLAAVGLFAAVALLPVAWMLADSLFRDGRPDLSAYATVLADARQWSLLRTTIALGLLGTGGAVLLGLPYAFLIARTEFPLRSLFSVAYVVPVLTPPLILAWGWTRTPDWFLLGDLRGLGGCALVFALCYHPLVTLLSAHGFRSIDAGLEESARLAGGPWNAFRRVTLRLAMPAVLSGALLCFIFTISDFALPDFVSTLGPKQNVYAGEIFFRAKRLESMGQATAASLPLVVLTGLALAGILWMRGRRSFEGLTGEFRRPRPIRLRGFRAAGAVAFCGAVVSVSVVAPFGSMLATAGGLASYRKAIANPGARKDILNSLGTAALAATLMTLVGFLLAYAIVHLRRSGRRRASAALETSTILPLAIPALMMGIGLIRIWNRPWLDPVYLTPWMVLLVYAARFLPFPVVALGSGLSQVGREIEEAGALVGASFFRRLTRLVAPLLRHSFSAAWILAFLFSMRELDTMVLIPAGNATLPFRVFNEIHFGRDAEIAAISLIMVFLIAVPLLFYCVVTSRRLDLFGTGAARDGR